MERVGMTTRLVVMAVVVVALVVAAVVLATVPSSPNVAPVRTVSARGPALTALKAQVPAACFPHSRQAASTEPARAGSTHPLKDLAIQPSLLTVPQWTSLLDLAEAAGSNVIEVGVNWAAYEPTGPAPAHEFSSLSAFVSAVRSRGMKVRFQLFGFPSWARDAGDPSATQAQWLAPQRPDELARWSAFVGRVVSTFGTSVSFYEIWNEENLSVFWSAGPSPTSYANLLVCSYVTVKDLDPHATIVSGGLSTNDMGYLSKLYVALDRFPLAQADNHFFDVLGLHPYSSGRGPTVTGPDHVVEGEFGKVDTNFTGFVRMKALMVAEGDPDKKIYIGEYGWPVSQYPADQDNDSGAVTEEQRASWIPTAYRLAGESGDVLAMSWYVFYPSPYDTPAWALVVNPNGSTDPTTHWLETPSFKAFARVP
jgi:hypothetical protein